MFRHKKVALLLLMFTSYTALSGMVCGRATDFTAQVLNPFRFQLSLVEALTKAKIPAVDGKIPEGKDLSIPVEFVATLDLENNPKSKPIFEQYGSKIHSVYINGIRLDVDKNSFTTDLPRADVAIAPFGKTDFKIFGSFDAITAKEEKTSSQLLWEPEGYKIAHDALKGFRVQLRLSVPLRIKGGTPYPKRGEGILEVTIQAQIAFTFKPI